MMNKGQLRKQLLFARSRLGPEQLSGYSTVIAKNLFTLPAFQQAGVVMFYLSTPHEVATDAMIEMAWGQGKQVVVPYCTATTGVMDAVPLLNLQDVHIGRYGIRESNQAQVIDKRRIEAVILPCVGFDGQGNRIGYGAGYYDRFLSVIPSVLKIGLAFSVQKTPYTIDTGPFDMAVDYMITEQGVVVARPFAIDTLSKGVLDDHA